MSTIKVNKIENTATADGGIAIDASGHVTLDGQQLPTAGALSNRNLIINGAMQVAQRGTSTASVTTTGYHATDRMKYTLTTLGTWTVSQENTGFAETWETGAAQQFRTYHKILCTTADSSPAAADKAILNYFVEAQDLQHLNYGETTAKSLTLSFWVKSNKTGNASFEATQNDNSNKHVSFQYTISAANTWEYKTINIPADTSGVINNDTGSGLQLAWFLNSGSDFTSGSHQSSWSVFSTANRNPSNLGVGGAVNDYFAITGVQLEVGAKSTEFEHRSFNDELAKCCRYFQKSYNYADAPGTSTNAGSIGSRMDASSTATSHPGIVFRHTMRANATVTLYSPHNGAFPRVSDRGTGLTSHTNNGTVSSIFGAGQNGFAAMALAAAEGPAITYHYTAAAEL